jgi:DNA anti-recombination protein RmuC
MESRSSSKTKARLIVLAVFVIGFAAGALSLNLYERLTTAAPEPELRGNDYIIRKMDQKLSLSTEQEEKIKAILEDRNNRFGEIRKEIEPLVKPFEPRFDALRQEARDKIRAVLTDGQRPAYEELLKDADSQREKFRKEKVKQ